MKKKYCHLRATPFETSAPIVFTFYPNQRRLYYCRRLFSERSLWKRKNRTACTWRAEISCGRELEFFATRRKTIDKNRQIGSYLSRRDGRRSRAMSSIVDRFRVNRSPTTKRFVGDRSFFFCFNSFRLFLPTD